MNESRANEALKNNGIQKLLKAYSTQVQVIQPVVGELFENVIKYGKQTLDANSLIILSTCK